MAPLLTAWVDQTLAPGDRQRVEDHLAACPSCRRGAERERAVHQLVRARAPELREAAPPHLRARLAATPARAGAARPAPRRPLWQLPAAAVIALTVLGAGLFGALLPSGTLLAAQLAFDHLKCRLLAHDEPGVSPDVLAARWQASQGWAIDVPPGDPAHDLTLTGLRRCLFHGGSMAHLLYDYHGEPVSLFVLRGARQAPPGLEIMGTDTVVWSTGERTMAVVGRLPAADVQALAARFAGHAPR
jgi:anti-sigma factor RsiW